MSPEPDSTDGADSPTAARGDLNTWNCLCCRKRKLRCNRTDPCSNCQKVGLRCSYPVTGRIPTRRSNTEPETGSRRRQVELMQKLNRLEGIVDQLSAQCEGQSQDCQPLDNHEPAAQHPRPAHGSGELIAAKHGGTYIDNGFWISLREESKKLLHEIEDFANIDSTNITQNISVATHQRPFFSVGDFVSQTEDWFPLPSQMPYIWQIYINNVDPCIKTLHIPTTTGLIEEARWNINNFDPVTRALMCSVILSSIVSLSEEEVAENFQRQKYALISSLSWATERAMMQAGFFSTPDIRLLQAAVIYLDSLGQQNGSRTVWTMTGFLTRTAVSIGLHRESDQEHASPFNVEIRRRLWWHICFLDMRFGETQPIELSISEQMFDTQEPTNLNDADIFEQMTETPRARVGFTDMTFCLLRCQLWRLLRRVQTYISLSRYGDEQSINKELATFRETSSQIQNDTLSHLDLSKPMHRLIDALAHINLARIEMLVTKRSQFGDKARVERPEPERDAAFISALTNLQRSHEVQDDSDTCQWSWVFRGCIPWDSLGILLVRLLGAKEWTVVCETALETVMKEVKRIPNPMKQEPARKSLWDVLEVVQRRRIEEMQRNGDFVFHSCVQGGQEPGVGNSAPMLDSMRDCIGSTNLVNFHTKPLSPSSSNPLDFLEAWPQSEDSNNSFLPGDLVTDSGPLLELQQFGDFSEVGELLGP